MRRDTFDDLARMGDGTYRSYEARIGWLMWQARAAIATQAAQQPKDVGVSLRAGLSAPLRSAAIPDAECDDRDTLDAIEHAQDRDYWRTERERLYSIDKDDQS